MFADNIARCMGLGAAVLCAACAGNSAPKGWLPKPQEAQTAAYGGWIELTYLDGTEERRTDAELIAVSAESVWVLNEHQGLGIPAGAESRVPERKSPPLPWVELAPFARFPQGIPEGIGLSGLSTKKARGQAAPRP